MIKATLLLLALFSPCSSAAACFADHAELLSAVDSYAADPSPNSSLALTYGHPIGAWCVGNVTHLAEVFSAERNANMTSFNEDVSGWNVSSALSLNSMFLGARAFDRPIGAWDVSAVVDMRYVFQGASAFNQSLNAWDVSRVITMSAMFRDATSFNQPLSAWNVSGVRSMNSLFQGASSFNQPLAAWDISAISDTERMFYRASSFNQPLASWDVSRIWRMRGMFQDATAFNQPLDAWDVSRVSNMEYMFQRASAYNQPLGAWNVSRLDVGQYMFDQAVAFNQPLDSWDVSDLLNVQYMFRGAVAFNQTLASWSLSSLTNARSMFESTSAFRQNLCSWGSRLPSSFTVSNMFLRSRCPDQGDPLLGAEPLGPLCFPCPMASTYAATTALPPTMPPAAATVPPVVSGTVTVGNTTVTTVTNVTQGSSVVVQGTLMVVPDSQLNVGDGSDGAVFQVTGDATVSGGNVNVALSEKPPPDTPVTVELIEGASVSGSFDDITASVPDFDPACESLNVEQQSTGTSISAVVTLTNFCVGGLHPGALAGIIVGCVFFVALVIALPIYLHERRVRQQTKSMLRRLDNHL